jgi:ATP-binding cassette subfamily B protein
MGQRVAYDLRNRIFAHLQSLSPGYFDRANTGDLMSRATSDVEGVRVFIAESLTSLLQMLFLFPTALGLMLSMSWRLTAIVCGLFPVLGYAVVMFRGRIRPRYLEAQEQYGRVATALQENLAGMRLIQAYRRESSEVQRFHQLNQELLRANLAAARERAVFFPLILLLGSSMGAVILWFGGSQVIAGTLTLGELVAFLGYLGVLSRPIMLLGWVISLAQRAIASLTRIEEILSLAPALPSPPMPVAHARGTRCWLGGNISQLRHPFRIDSQAG